MDFSKMTVSGLKEYAEENNIDLGSAKTKTAILSIITETKSNISAPNNVVGSTKLGQEKRNPRSNTKADENSVITVGSADTFKNKEFRKDTQTPEDKVAIYSDKNMYWQELGRIVKGYNIVNEEAAKRWLTRKGIRQATPEEVASYYIQ